MRVNYNRVTREIWITDPAGNVRARRTAAPGAKMVDEAGKFLTEHGFARTGDYMLVADGSPMRRATIVGASTYASGGTGTVYASAVARILNDKFRPGRFNVEQNGDKVTVHGPQYNEAARYLQAKGYRVAPQTAQEFWVIGKVES